MAMHRCQEKIEGMKRKHGGVKELPAVVHSTAGCHVRAQARRVTVAQHVVHSQARLLMHRRLVDLLHLQVTGPNSDKQ